MENDCKLPNPEETGVELEKHTVVEDAKRENPKRSPNMLALTSVSNEGSRQLAHSAVGTGNLHLGASVGEFGPTLPVQSSHASEKPGGYEFLRDLGGTGHHQQSIVDDQLDSAVREPTTHTVGTFESQDPMNEVCSGRRVQEELRRNNQSTEMRQLLDGHTSQEFNSEVDGGVGGQSRSDQLMLVARQRVPAASAAPPIPTVETQPPSSTGLSAQLFESLVPIEVAQPNIRTHSRSFSEGQIVPTSLTSRYKDDDGDDVSNRSSLNVQKSIYANHAKMLTNRLENPKSHASKSATSGIKSEEKASTEYDEAIDYINSFGPSTNNTRDINPKRYDPNGGNMSNCKPEGNYDPTFDEVESERNGGQISPNEQRKSLDSSGAFMSPEGLSLIHI